MDLFNCECKNKNTFTQCHKAITKGHFKNHHSLCWTQKLIDDFHSNKQGLLIVKGGERIAEKHSTRGLIKLQVLTGVKRMQRRQEK